MKYKSLKSCFHDPSEDEKAEYKKRISQENTRNLPFQIHGYPAFFTLSSEVFELCYKVQLKNAEIARLSAQAPSLQTLLFRCLLKEIEMSNEIEGVHSSRKELLAVKNKYEKNRHDRFSGQLRQYQNLLNQTPKIPANSQEIRDLYDRLLLEDVRAEDPDCLPDGELFRADSVSVVGSRGPVHTGVWPEKEMVRILDETLHQLLDTPSLITGSILHFVFGYVHPFYDGNGRLGRYLSTVVLAQDFEMAGILQLSLVIRENRKKYYKAFELCESEVNKGDLTPFLISFLELIFFSFESGAALLKDNFSLYQQGMKNLKSLDLPKNDGEFMKLVLTNLLFGYQSLSATEAAKTLNVSPSTIRNLVKKYRTYLYEEKDGKIRRFTLNRDFLDHPESM